MAVKKKSKATNKNVSKVKGKSVAQKMVTKTEPKKTNKTKWKSKESWNTNWKAKTQRVIEVPKLEISNDVREDSKKLMRSIFNIQSFSQEEARMKFFIKHYIWGLNDDSIILEDDAYGNIYITKGVANTYPCIVSHIDTVHDIIPDEDYFVSDNDKNFFAIDMGTMGRTGVGGDDKNGIYCCLDNLNKFDNIKLAFFVEEEIGCVGSSNADMQFFDDVSFVLQADRKGYEDVVNSISGIELFDKDFENKLSDVFSRYNRVVGSGGMTDVMMLTENGLDVCVANFSSGYYNPHRETEYVVIDELILTSCLFTDIINEAYVDGERWFIDRDDISAQEAYLYKRYGGVGTKKKDKELSAVEIEENDFVSNEISDIRKVDGGSEATIWDYDTFEECSMCGGSLVIDASTDAYYCHGCQDYDYTKGGVMDNI